MIKEQLKQQITDHTACIGVIGLGYVGLPLIVEFALKGFRGIGFEVDERKIAEINSGNSYIVDVPPGAVKSCVEAGNLTATADFSQLADCEVIIICVPTPLRKT
jgi:UDP-N-acetyl-D-glucosamine dehydrogenase